MRGYEKAICLDRLMHRCRSMILLVTASALTQVALSSGARAQQFDVPHERFRSFFSFQRNPKSAVSSRPDCTRGWL